TAWNSVRVKPTDRFEESTGVTCQLHVALPPDWLMVVLVVKSPPPAMAAETLCDSCFRKNALARTVCRVPVKLTDPSHCFTRNTWVVKNSVGECSCAGRLLAPMKSSIACARWAASGTLVANSGSRYEA